MKFAKSALFAATMLSAVSASAVEVSGNVALGSEYFFRGYDQSAGAALSGGFDIATESGIYAGAWGSSVDSATSTGGLELDYYIGFGGSVSDSVSYDVGYIFYGYPNDTGKNFEEFYGSVSFADVTVGLATSNDWYNETGSYDYIYADYAYELSEDYSLGLHYGTSSGAEDYDDYAISVSTEVSGLGLDLSWISTSTAEGSYADNEFVLTISKSL